MQLAQEFRAPLIFMCSKSVRAADVLAADWLDPEHEVIAVDFAPHHGRVAVEFASARHAEAKRHRETTDVASKRNVALQLGRMLRWNRLLFLDDDIFDLSFDQVRRASAALGSATPVIGWVARDFADNSTVFHARRVVGLECDQFIGAGALMVDCCQDLSFFPETYNEDWLFMLRHLMDGAVLQAGDVRQIPYNPFADVVRALSEEFGDILGEGLFHLVHEHRKRVEGESLGNGASGHVEWRDTARDPAYWALMLADRVTLLDDLADLARVRDDAPSDDIEALSLAIGAVRKRHLDDAATRDANGHTDWSKSLAGYVARWLDDRDRWEVTWRDQVKVEGLDQAMVLLNLRAHRTASA